MINIDSSTTGTFAAPQQIRGGRRRQTTSTGDRPAYSNSAAALKLLTRSRGATIVELAAATGWQPHSVRAHLSGLRKKGVNLLRELRKSGEGAYRVANAGAGASSLRARKAAEPADAVGLVDTPDTADAVTGTTKVSEATATGVAA